MSDELTGVLREVEAQWVAMTSRDVVDEALWPPAADDELAAVEEHLGLRVPGELRTFWRWHAGMRSGYYLPTYITWQMLDDCIGQTIWWREKADIAAHSERSDLPWSEAIYVGDIGGGAYHWAIPNGDDGCRIVTVEKDGGAIEGPDSLTEGFSAFLQVLRSGIWNRAERGYWRYDIAALTFDERRRSLLA